MGYILPFVLFFLAIIQIPLGVERGTRPEDVLGNFALWFILSIISLIVVIIKNKKNNKKDISNDEKR